MIKTELYKRIDGNWHYWRAGCRGQTVVVHSGKVGSPGEVKEIAVGDGETPNAVITRWSRQARARGYAEIDTDNLVQLVIQYLIVDMGSADDLDKRQQVEEILNDCLGSTGNGYCDGGDIGSGTMNLFCNIVAPRDAVESVRFALQNEQLLDGATIALRERNGDCYEVVWPSGYEGEFALV